MRTLPPLILKEKYYDPIEATIRAIFDDLIYWPLLTVLQMNFRELTSELKNSRDPLYEAMSTGTIWYDDGQFKGKFNSKTSAAIIRLGAKYNVPSATYSLPKDKVPVELRIAQEHANIRYESMRTKMLSVLDNIDPKNIGIDKIKAQYQHTIGEMESDFQATLPEDKFDWRDNPITQNISLGVTLLDEQKKIIAEQWAANLDLYIKDWVSKSILDLREQIQPHILAGGRAEGLEKSIRDNYGVGIRKARFLARQETSLLMSKFQETRYMDLGITKYRWSDAHDVRVRHDHHELNGKIFSWKSPPISNKKTGARNNPGEDFGCRCIAIPVL